MSANGNMIKIRKFVSDFNHGNLVNARKYLSPEFFNHVPARGEPKANDVIYRLLSDFRNAGSNVRLSISNLEDDGGVLRGRMTLKGTHTGPLWGAPPTGNQFEMTADIAIKEKDGRFAPALENLALPEILAALRQIELVPPRMDMPSQHPVAFPELLLKVIFTGQVADKPCSHLHMIQVTEPDTNVCEECVESGDEWPALRMCLTCGYVGCCDASVNKHMKRHYQLTGHPLFRSIHLDEGWVWCYKDNAFFSRRILE